MKTITSNIFSIFSFTAFGLLTMVGCTEGEFLATQTRKASSHSSFQVTDNRNDSLSPAFEVIDGEVIVYGDISLGTLEDVKKFGGHILGETIIPPEGQFLEEMVSPDSLIVGNSKFVWPEGVIPYVLSEEIKNHKENLKDIKQTKAYFEGRWGHDIPIKLVPRTDQEDYVEFVLSSSPTSSSSSIGRQGGKQLIKLAYRERGAGYSTVIHEVGHAAGLLHEHQRPDRDMYVNIHDENIVEGKKHNFRMATGSYYERYPKMKGPYDYRSVMHYRKYTFSKDKNLPTITSKTDQEIKKMEFGLFSAGDIAALKEFHLGLDSTFDLKSLSAKAGDSSIYVKWNVKTNPEVKFWEFRLRRSKKIETSSGGYKWSYYPWQEEWQKIPPLTPSRWEPWRKSYNIRDLDNGYRYFVQVRSCREVGDCIDASIYTVVELPPLNPIDLSLLN